MHYLRKVGQIDHSQLILHMYEKSFVICIYLWQVDQVDHPQLTQYSWQDIEIQLLNPFTITNHPDLAYAVYWALN